MSTDTLPDTLAEVQRLIDQVSDRLATIATAVDRLSDGGMEMGAGCSADTDVCPIHEIGDPDCDRLRNAPDPAAPAYHPERMGYLDELRVGDRVLFAGGWREVNEVDRCYGHNDGQLVVWFTDPDMDWLADKGTYAIRIQKRADEQQADALHRRDHGGL